MERPGQEDHKFKVSLSCSELGVCPSNFVRSCKKKFFQEVVGDLRPGQKGLIMDLVHCNPWKMVAIPVLHGIFEVGIRDTIVPYSAVECAKEICYL